MQTTFRSVSPSSETYSESAKDRTRLEKALITKTPTRQNFLGNKSKNYSDMNSNEVSKPNHGRKSFIFWFLVILLFILAVGNILLTFSIIAILRLGQGMESLEFLPEMAAIKFFGDITFDHVYKKDGLIESFRDVPMSVQSEEGAVSFNVQTRFSRSDTKLVVNSSGVFIKGVNSLDVIDPDSQDIVFSTAAAGLNIPEPINNVNAKVLTTYRIASPIDENLTIRTESSAFLRGAEGTHMESKEINWSADQDIYIKSINGTISLSAKDGVFVDVKYLPIAKSENKSDSAWASHSTGHFKICVCMPQGKLFRIAVPNGQKVSCSHINTSKDLNPCA